MFENDILKVFGSHSYMMESRSYMRYLSAVQYLEAYVKVTWNLKWNQLQVWSNEEQTERYIRLMSEFGVVNNEFQCSRILVFLHVIFFLLCGPSVINYGWFEKDEFWSKFPCEMWRNEFPGISFIYLQNCSRS